MPSIASESADEPLVERIAEEIVQRQRAGEHPTVEEYCDQYPECADELRTFLPAILVVEGLKPNSNDQSGSFGSTVQIAGTHNTTIGDYRILSELGRGGMGVVYEAEQQALGRRVALKVLQRPSSRDKKAERRFEIEARSAARMHHTNIVPVFDVGSDEKHLYYAMQLIQGQSLDLVVSDLKTIRSRRESESTRSKSQRSDSHRIAHSLLTGQFRREDLADDPIRSPAPGLDLTETTAVKTASSTSAVLPGQSDLSSAEDNRSAYYLSVARIGHQTADALSYAHTRGIIHRDIKPSNLLLDGNGTVWITDFGLAKSGDTDMTHTGDILGTLRYMSPERFKGQCDVRADVYGLGLTLYEMLVLKPAFDSPDRLTLIDMVSRTEIEPPRSIDPRIPLDLETIVLKACDQDPKRRYQSADDLADDLQRFINDEPIQARRASLLERSARWSRHNPWLAASVSIATVALILIACLASYSAAIQKGLNSDKDDLILKQESMNAELAVKNAERESMIEELRQSQTRLAERQAEFMTEKGRHNEAMLWLARAYELTEEADESLRRKLLGKLSVAAEWAPRLLEEHCVHSERAEPLQTNRPSTVREMFREASMATPNVTRGQPMPRNVVVSPDQSLIAFRKLRPDPQSEFADQENLSDQEPSFRPQSVWKVWDVDRSTITGRPIIAGNAERTIAAINGPNRLLALLELEPHPKSEINQQELGSPSFRRSIFTLSLSVWDLADGRRLFDPIRIDIRIRNNPFSTSDPAIAFRAGGEEIVIAYLKADSTSQIAIDRFDCRSGELIKSVSLARQGDLARMIAGFELSPDGTRLVLTPPGNRVLAEMRIGRPSGIWCYDVESAQPLGTRVLIDPQQRIRVASPDANHFCVSRANGNVGFVDVQSGNTSGTVIPITGDAGSVARIVNVSKSAGRMVVAYRAIDGSLAERDAPRHGQNNEDLPAKESPTTVQVFNTLTGKALSPPLPVRGRVRAAPISPAGRRWTIWDDRGPRVWDLSGVAPLTTVLPNPIGMSRQVNRNLDGFLQFLNSSRQNRSASERKATLRRNAINPYGAIALGSQGRFRIAWPRSYDQSGELNLAAWNSMSGGLIQEQSLYPSDFHRIECFNLGGDLLLTSDLSGLLEDPPRKQVQLWRSDSGEMLDEPVDLAVDETAESVGPAGRRMVISKTYTRPQRTGNRVRRRENSTSAARELAQIELILLDRDTKQRTSLAVPTRGGLRKTKLAFSNLLPLQTHFSSDGNLIVVRIGSTVNVFNADGEHVRRTQLNRDQTQFNPSEQFSRSAVSPDANVIAISGGGPIVELFSLIDGQKISPPMVHPASVTHLAFGSDGLTMATAAADGLVRFWELPDQWPGDVEVISDRIATQTSLELTATGEVRQQDRTSDKAGETIWTSIDPSDRRRLSDLETRSLNRIAQENWSDAETALAECVERFPNRWQYQLLRIRTLVEQEKFREAESVCELASENISEEIIRLWLESRYRQLTNGPIRQLRGRQADQQLVWYAKQMLQTHPSATLRAELSSRLITLSEYSLEPEKKLRLLNDILQTNARNISLLSERASLLERMKRWDEAIHDRERIAKLDPDQHFHPYRLLALYLYTENSDAFWATWQQMFDKWGGSDEPRIPERLAKPALLFDEQHEVMDLAMELADRAYDHRKTDDQYVSFDILVKGLAQYRLGNFDSALGYLKESQSLFESRGRPRYGGLPLFFIAMAQHKQGFTEEALRSYQAGVDRNEYYYDRIIRTDGSMLDWLFTEHARRKAATVLQIELDHGEPPPLPDTKDWMTLFEDDFNRNQLGPRWSQAAGWSIEDGAVCGQVALGRQASLVYDNTIDLLDEPIPAVAEITFDAWWPDSALAELQIANKFHFRYLVGLSGYEHPGRTPFGESGKGPHLRDKFVVGKNGQNQSDIIGVRWTAVRPDIELESGKHYHVRILQQPQYVRVWIDDEEVIAERVPCEDGSILQLHGSGPKSAKVYFDNLRIRTPED